MTSLSDFSPRMATVGVFSDPWHNSSETTTLFQATNTRAAVDHSKTAVNEHSSPSWSHGQTTSSTENGVIIGTVTVSALFVMVVTFLVVFHVSKNGFGFLH